MAGDRSQDDEIGPFAPMSNGAMLSHYKIVGKLGAGGMGEVYRAVDTRLDRTVAIKVLSSQAALSADMRARFEREARTISSLNHPHICTLYDVGHQEGMDYLVMECMEGEELSRRLQRGHIEVAEALTIAVQVASGLEAAHRKGVIHRDLKPNNIFLTSNGAKLLDFGLAKLHAEPVTGMGDETHTTPVTGAGAIVGTLQYMSPEQLEGKEADARSDIFSFGATLYEMVTGHRAFTGESKVSLISSIMKEEPRQIGEIVPSVPPALERLIRKCLRKDPEKRWQSAGDLRDELEWILSAGSQAGIPAPVASRRRLQLRLSWVVAAIALCIAGILAVHILAQKETTPKTTRFRIPQIPGTTSMHWPQVSPDGSMIAFVVADSTGVNRIWIRPLNSVDAYVLAGTEGASFAPIWSPDSKYVAFFTVDRLKKVPFAGGPVQVVCESLGADGTWGKNGLILFDAAVRGIAGVASTGGVLKQYTVFDSTRGDVDHSWPWFLPDGDHFLFHVLDSTRWQDFTRGELELQVRIGSINSSVTESLLTANSRVEYCDPGFLIYVNRHHLVAHPFDADNLKFAGESVPVVSVHSIASAYGLEFSVSNNGTLAYMASGPSAPLRLGYLVRVDRDGNVLDTIGGKALYGDATYSPDNSMVAYCSFPELRQSYDITIYNTEHKTMTSITNDQRIDYVPVWSPDGSTIAYGSQRERLFPHNVTLQSISDASANRVLDFPDSLAIIPLQWTKDDRILLEEGVLQVAATVPRVWSCPVDHQDSARLLLGGPLKEVAYGLSPDNRYLLTVLQTGTTREVFLVDLQGNKARRRVSTGEGDYPRWRSDGREIYYLEGDVLLAVPVSYSPELQLGEPEKLFRLEVPPHWKDETTNFSYFGYDATRDGKEFVVVKSASKVDQPAECEVIVNWPSEIGVGQ